MQSVQIKMQISPNEEHRCPICKELMIDPVTLGCCGTSACLWCLDPDLPIDLSNPLHSCPNCRGPMPKTLMPCKALVLGIDRSYGQAEISQERERRRLAARQLVQHRAAAQRYMKSARLMQLESIAKELIEAASEPFLFVQEFAARLDAKARAVGLQALEVGEAEALLATIGDRFGAIPSLWRRGDLIRMDSFPSLGIATARWAEVELFEMTHALDQLVGPARQAAVQGYAEYKKLQPELISALKQEQYAFCYKYSDALCRLVLPFAHKLTGLGDQPMSSSSSTSSSESSSSCTPSPASSSASTEF